MINIDETILIDNFIPQFWECPHCGRVMITDEQANDILIEHFIVLRQCEECGFVHCWKLRLTEKFKKNIVKLLLNGINRRTKDE